MLLSESKEEEEMRAEDYTTVYSEKKQLYYYYNYKTKKSQWKKPSCLQGKGLDRIKKKKQRLAFGFKTS